MSLLQRFGRHVHQSGNMLFKTQHHQWRPFTVVSKSHAITSEELKEYNENGIVVKRKLFDTQEIQILRDTIQRDHLLREVEYTLSDDEGGHASLIIWKYLEDDTYGNFLQSKRMIDIIVKLLNVDSYKQVQHYHTKLNCKHAKVGGAFIWHQDYGYWYQNGLIYPNLCTSFIAIDPCNKSNGLLQILKGSHKMGRIDHEMVGGQNTITDKERFDYILSKHETIAYELEPGDTMFFDCNVVHRSDQNKSDKSRVALLGCYNNINNLPYKQHHHYCTPIQVYPDSQIKSMGAVPTRKKDIFMDPSIDETVRVD